MTALEDIITWGNNKLRPWQKDALRRVVENEQLSEQDVGELAQLCRHERGVQYETDEAVAPRAIDQAQVSRTGTRRKVKVLSISEVVNLNRLTGETPLEFGATGLTVIYGDNGSGKTGYSRVLNVLCRARDTATIHRNVFSADETEPSARLDYTVDGTPVSVTWTKGAIAPPELQNISVFDVKCASVYVAKDHEVAYAPFGLDILDRLAKAYQRVQQHLETERNGLMNAAPVWPEGFAGTSVEKWLDTLPDASALASLRTLASMSAEEAEDHLVTRRLVGELQRTNPTQTIVALQSLSTRLGTAANLLDGVATTCGDAALTELKRVTALAASTAQAAQVAATDPFKNEPITGIGEDIWRQLWESARRFSEQHAYRGQPFPVVGDGARCPLCLQELDPDGKDRFARFEAHIRQDLAKAARSAEVALKGVVETLQKLVVMPAQLDQLATELEAHDPALATDMKDAFGTAEARRDAMVLASKDASWEKVPALAGIDASRIRALASALSTQAEALKESLAKGELPKQEAKLKEYDARVLLVKELPTIEAELLRLEKIAKLNLAIDKDTDTTALSKTSTTLTKRYVTDELANQFAEELKALSADELAVVLEKKKSQHGITSHQVKLRDVKFPAAVGDVVSEGEQSAIALAAFLAEVQQTPADAGIVLDDPVTSMDHLRRERVAARLVAEASKRQTIVFTHEIVFLMELVRVAEDAAVPLKVQTVYGWASKTGMPESDLPWIAMSVGRRVGFLKSRLQEAKARHAKSKGEYESFAKDTYGFLREAWERGVEELVLNGVVRRFERAVETQRLKKVAEDTRLADYEAVDEGMSRCSEFFRGHDAPPSAGQRTPSLVDLEADIQKFEAWVAAIQKRRR